MSGQPWMKFYPSDWRADPSLRMCSLAARGLWIEMLAIMHEADPRGHLVINGKVVPPKHLCALVGTTEDEVIYLLSELAEAGVFSVKRNGVVFSRRMERDEQNSRKARDNGKMGGNPSLCNQTENGKSLKGGDKTQKPEARYQIPDREKTEANASAKKTDPKGHPIGDFQPEISVAIDMGMTRSAAEIQAASFRDYWIAKPGKDGRKLDWPATWRNWIRNKLDRNPTRNAANTSKAAPALTGHDFAEFLRTGRTPEDKPLERTIDGYANRH